jgi:hypothetical protein
MGSEEEIQTMMKQFKQLFTIANHEYPAFNETQNYFMIQKGNKVHEMVSDAWENFRAGWVSRGLIDQYTIEGWQPVSH